MCSVCGVSAILEELLDDILRFGESGLNKVAFVELMDLICWKYVEGLICRSTGGYLWVKKSTSGKHQTGPSGVNDVVLEFTHNYAAAASLN